jgi:hypothetical protein
MNADPCGSGSRVTVENIFYIKHKRLTKIKSYRIYTFVYILLALYNGTGTFLPNNLSFGCFFPFLLGLLDSDPDSESGSGSETLTSTSFLSIGLLSTNKKKINFVLISRFKYAFKGIVSRDGGRGKALEW